MVRLPSGVIGCPKCGYGDKKSVALHWDAVSGETVPEWEIKEQKGTGTLVIEGYASTWQEDRDGDVIDRRAFDETLSDYLTDNPVLLKDHNREQVLGNITKAIVDDIGLRIRAEVPKPEAEEERWKHTAYHDIKRGLRRALSIGGIFHRGSGTEKAARKTIHKVNLFEISNISVPSNPKSLFTVIGEKGLSFELETKGTDEERDAPELDEKGEGEATSAEHTHLRTHAKLGSSLTHTHPLPVGLARHRHEGFRAAVHTTKEAATEMAETKGAPTAEAEETPTNETKGVTLSEAEFKELSGRLERFETEQKAVKMREQAEAIAEQKAQEKLAEEKTAHEAKMAEMSTVAKMAAELLDAKLATYRTGRKYAPSGDGWPSGTEGSTVGRKAQDERSSMIHLLFRKAQGDGEARAALLEMSHKAASEYGEKALVEATGSAGYLVPPQYWQQGIAEYRLAAAKVRQLCTVINGINTNLVYIPRETGIATVAWVGEGAPKPQTDQTFGQLAVNIFTLAGISKVSNQLLEDSSPAVDQIVRKDLGRLLGQAEDIAFLTGTGSGQPTGILNTTGILTGAIGSATLADALASAISAIQSNYYGDPEAILMHPKHLNVLRTAKDANNRYIFEPAFFPGNSPAMRAYMDNNGPGGPNGSLGGGYNNFPSQGGPQGTVWGLPVFADANLPTPANAGNAIVGAFSEAYILERTGVTIDVSSEAGTSFEQNQTWFRGEERLGFTAARQPTAFYAVTGLP